MFHRLTTGTLLLVYCLFPTISFGHQLPQTEPLNQNAALAYWQAFAVIPDFSESEMKLRDQILNGIHPLDEEARKLAQQSENALRYLHRGAKLENAAWGVAWDEGPYALLPHLSKARDLTRLVAFRAHVLFEDGKHEQAVEDLLAAMTLGRHVSREGVIVLIPLLVDYAIESICMQTLAAHLPDIDAQTRANLKRRLAALPPLAGLSKAIQGEKDVFLSWLIKEVKKPEAKRRVLDIVGKVDDREIQAFKKLDEKELLPATRRMGDYYDQLIRSVKLSPKALQLREDELFQKIKNNGAKDFLSRWLLPNAVAGRRAEVRHVTRMALFQAGLAVLEQGEKVLGDPKYRDPFGDGAFAYRKTKTGFVLESDWKQTKDGKKVSLTFGKPTTK